MTEDAAITPSAKPTVKDQRSKRMEDKMDPTEFKLHVYLDGAREWRWRLLAANGRSVAVSGEGYQNRGDCVEIAQRLFGIEPEEGPAEIPA